MNEDIFKRLSDRYSGYISKLINNNIKFYRFYETIKWSFSWDDEICISASVNKNTNIISLNLKFIVECMNNNEEYNIEYFLLHEIRHVFQNIMIKDYTNHEESCVSNEIIEKWIYENDNYETALNINGIENPNYPEQDIEMDAYAFSYAVMKYKYGDEICEKLYLPSTYGDEFNKIVDSWITQFELEKM